MSIKVHESVTQKRVSRMVQKNMWSVNEEDWNKGICLRCGKTQRGCEPDARKYKCAKCGAEEVYGAEEILMIGAFHPTISTAQLGKGLHALAKKGMLDHLND